MVRSDLGFVRFASGGVVAPFEWTASRNYGAISGSRNVTAYRSYVDDQVEWQASVYEYARAISREIAFDLVIDIGCGSGRNSLKQFQGSSLLQVDISDRRDQKCRDAGISFCTVCLESYDDLDVLQNKVLTSDRTLIICADVIEHLIDPRPLLSCIRRILMKNSGNRAVISTPDHGRMDGSVKGQVPINREHVRQWSVFDFGKLLRSAGFQVLEYGLCKMNPFDDLNRTIFAELACSPGSFEEFLELACLPASGKRLLVTSEHKLLGRGGGIGTYAYHSELTLPGGTICLLTCEDAQANADNVSGKHRFLSVKGITGSSGQPLSTLEAVKSLLFLYSDISVIEFQDYLGVGHMIGQAGQAGILPSRIATVCGCHGNHIYLESNHGYFFFEHELHAREKLAIETAKHVFMPSSYLERLYYRAGLRPQRIKRLAYPYQFEFSAPSEADYGRIDTIIFFGKRTIGKGYKLFVDAINYLEAQRKLDGIQRIIVAGTGNDEFEFAPSLIGQIESVVYNSNEVTSVMHKFRHHALAVLPYLGDNFPMSVHQMFDAGVQAIFADAGGIPEVIADCDPIRSTLFKPDAKSLAAIIERKLELSGVSRGLEIVELRRLFFALQERRNRAFVDFFESLGEPDPIETINLPSYQVVITYHNEEARFLQDCLDGLANQFRTPAKVIIVNDASELEAVARIRDVIAAETRVNIELVNTPRNLGLSGARNFGLQFIDSDFFIAHDVDNVLRSDAALKMLRAITTRSDVAAVTSHSRLFHDNHEWRELDTTLNYYVPAGPDLSEPNRNHFGDALAMYRRSAVEAVKFWRVSASGHEVWEDFELFYRLVLAGFQVVVLPEAVGQYRVRERSMLRTYAEFGGVFRMAEMLNEAIPGAGLAIIRRIAHEQHLTGVQDQTGRVWPVRAAARGQTWQEAPGNEAVSHAPELALRLAFAALPKELRSDQALRRAAQSAMWRKQLLRRPFAVLHWQAVRRLERLRKHGNGNLNNLSTLDLALSALPRKLRSRSALMEAASGKRSWKVEAWRHPGNITHWQSVRHIQRFNAKLGAKASMKA
jgi:glycosyltransferase involved in cell wall biosynthesis/SAM-dependent methyltransferase